MKTSKTWNENILPGITAFNPNNCCIYSTIKSWVNCLKNENSRGFHTINLTQSKRQTPNLNPPKLLTKSKYEKILLDVFNYGDKRCECCNYLLINGHYIFKNLQIIFELKYCFTCDIVASYILSFVAHVRVYSFPFFKEMCPKKMHP